MTTTARPIHPRIRLLLCAAAGAIALLAVGARAANAATSASLEPTGKCYLDVINDWLRHGQVEGVYAIPCYTQAIQHLDQFPDVKGYSSAEDDIRSALLAAIRQDRGGGGGTSSLGGPSGGPSNGNTSGDGGQTKSDGTGFVSRIGDAIGPGNAQSIPLPLLVLGGLAVLLLLAAGGTWFARRLQSRRVTPAPAPAPRR